MKVNFDKSNQDLVAAARKVAQSLQEAGYEALFAGGCVRDALCGRALKDVDIATSALPEQVEQLFAGRTVSIGKSFGVILVLEGKYQFDVASFRSDGAYVNGRHPEKIHFCCAEEDSLRRDFTINGLFSEPHSGRVIDYVGGLDDLKRGVVRAIGCAQDRFEEDSLRMLRAVRFASVMQFEIEQETWQAVCRMSSKISRVSIERITNEVVRMICEAPKPSIALNMLRESGMLAEFLPEVLSLYGVAQPPQFHPEGDVWTHTCMMLDGVEAPRDPILALGILFHDIGKPSTYSYGPHPKSGEVRIRFMGHADVGVPMTGKILTRLKLPNALIDAVKELVGHHMRFIDAQKMRKSTLRRLLGLENIDNLLILNKQDTLCSNGDLSGWEFLVDQYNGFQSEPALPPPLVNGKTLMQWGMKPGPKMGKLLKKLYNAQLEGDISSLEEAKKFCGM
ncbi:MAG: CCA tRNA nucleotidyltransferase [Kiritimatiellae bacterium]|jgi:tRNA nucleotidyltransferase/poly(A) polymerase|nr:CCA tRNA nucleotidyltransferase [Kiritimatiellia bacterium]